jgi:peptidoglycan/LPS O-acetylase OafA/YrhL
MFSASPSLSQVRWAALDGVRGLAILLVLFGHFLGALVAVPADSIWIYVPLSLRLTWSGVDLFFVLSGFLIGGILLDQRTATNYYQVFYLRRVCRIFPLYYLTLFLFFTLIALGATRLSPWLFDKPLPALAYLTFTQNYWSVWFVAKFGYPAFWPGVTWSLALEEQFYVIIAFVIRKLRRGLLPLLIAFIVLAPMLRTICYFAFPQGALMGYLWLPMRADAPLLGVLIAYGWRQPAMHAWILAHQHVFLIAMLTLGGALIGLNVWRQELALSGSSVMTTIGYTWVAVFYACLLCLVLAQPAGRLARSFCVRPLRWLGEISYGVYLIHIPVLGLCHALAFGQTPTITNRRELAVAMMALVISLVLAETSWRWFERPILHWGRLHKYNQ